MTGNDRWLTLGELNEAVAARLIVVLNGDACRDDLAKPCKVVMKVFVRPLTAKAFHEDISLGHTVAKEILIVGERSTHFTMQLRVLDLVDKLSRLHDIREAAESVVEILECRSIKSCEH